MMGSPPTPHPYYLHKVPLKDGNFTSLTARSKEVFGNSAGGTNRHGAEPGRLLCQRFRVSIPYLFLKVSHIIDTGSKVRYPKTGVGYRGLAGVEGFGSGF